MAGQQLIENRGTGGMIRYATRRWSARTGRRRFSRRAFNSGSYQIVQFASEHLLALAGARHTQFDGGGMVVDSALISLIEHSCNFAKRAWMDSLYLRSVRVWGESESGGTANER